MENKKLITENSAKAGEVKFYLIVYLTSMLLFVVLKILSSYRLFDFIGEYASEIINLSIHVLILGLIPLGMILLKNRKKEDRKQIFQTFQYKSISIKTVLLSVLIGILCYIGVVMVSSAFSGLLHVLGWRNPFIADDSKMNIGMFLFSTFSTAILPSMTEEFLNRGLLLSSLKKFGVKKAIVFSAVCFGLMHFNIMQVHYSIIMGFIFGYIAVAGKSIWPAVIIHFTNNFLSVLFSFLFYNSYSAYKIYEGFFNFIFSGDVFSVMLKSSITLILVYTAIIYLISKIFVIEKRRRLIKRLNEMSKDTTSLSSEHYIKMEEEIKQEYNLKQLMKAKNLPNYIMDIHLEDKQKQKEEFKKDYISKTILYSLIILSGLLTIFTLIWGFL